MPAIQPWAWIAVIAVLVLLSAFFSSSESAIFSLPASWIDEQAASGDDEARTLGDLREDPHRLLVTILVGNNVVNVAISTLTAVLLAQLFPAGTAAAAATVLASFVILIFGEIVPKSYGLGNARGWALRVARPLTVVERLLLPLVFVFDWITRRINALLGGEPAIEEVYEDGP
ncbi:MAG: CNNM domain-containing protein [Haloferacaceae archaeon]